MTANPWVLAARPKTLFVSVAPVAIGTAFAFSEGKGHLFAAIGCLLMSFAIQIFVNMTNDYNDFRNGVDRADRIGPVRVMHAGLLSEREMLKGIYAVALFVMVCSTFIALRCGWCMTAIGGASLVAAYCYTGGPYPYGYHAMGELFILPFFGPIAVGGTYYAQSLELHPAVFAASLASGFLSCAVLTAANIRDIDTDPLTGKMTLAVKLGRKYTRLEYMTLIGCTALIPLILWIGFGTSWGVLIAWLALPIFRTPLQLICTRTDGPPLIEALADTAKGTLIYCLLMSLGLFL